MMQQISENMVKEKEKEMMRTAKNELIKVQDDYVIDELEDSDQSDGSSKAYVRRRMATLRESRATERPSKGDHSSTTIQEDNSDIEESSNGLEQDS